MVRSGRGRTAALSVTALVVLVTLGACSAPEMGRLVEYQAGAGGVVVVDTTTVGEVIAFDDVVFCKEGAGVVEIEGVELVEANGGLSVVSFSVLPAGEAGQSLTHLTSPRQRLSEAGYPTTGPLLVDRVCPAEGEAGRESDLAGFTVLGLEVRRDTSAPGTARGVRVLYSSNGIAQTAVYPLGIVLCDDLYPAGPDSGANEQCVIEQLTSW